MLCTFHEVLDWTSWAALLPDNVSIPIAHFMLSENAVQTGQHCCLTMFQSISLILRCQNILAKLGSIVARQCFNPYCSFYVDRTSWPNWATLLGNIAELALFFPFQYYFMSYSNKHGITTLQPSFTFCRPAILNRQML